MRALFLVGSLLALYSCQAGGNPFSEADGAVDQGLRESSALDSFAFDGADAPVWVDALDGDATALDATTRDVSIPDASDVSVDSGGAPMDASAPDTATLDVGRDVSAEVGDSAVPSSLRIRFVAANLTSGNGQRYQDEGIRILRSTRADIVALQEFRYLDGTPLAMDEMVARAFGTPGDGVRYVRESDVASNLPNGVVSRLPIVRWGAWNDLVVINRDFLWAQIDIPGPHDLWILSVHLSATSSTKRYCETLEILDYLRCPNFSPPLLLNLGVACETNPPVVDPRVTCPADFPGIASGDYVLLGGDLNAQSRGEPFLQKLGDAFVVPTSFPVDPFGNGNTNSTRVRPFDWLLANAALQSYASSVTLEGPSQSTRFEHGAVLDTRTFSVEALPLPALMSDSAATSMEHMAVIREFVLPTQ